MGMRALFPFGTLGTLGLTFCGRLCARDLPNERFSVLVHPEVLDHDEQLTPRPFEVLQLDQARDERARQALVHRSGGQAFSQMKSRLGVVPLTPEVGAQPGVHVRAGAPGGGRRAPVQ